MLTILQDWTLDNGDLMEVAQAEGRKVTSGSRATCNLAAKLIAEGFAADQPTRIARADPYILPPPHKFECVSLSLVAQFDLFAIRHPAYRQELRCILGLINEGR